MIEKLEQARLIFTNGVGEKPYWRRLNEEIVIFVADDQRICEIPFEVENGYAEELANAICDIGSLLSSLQADMACPVCKGKKEDVGSGGYCYPCKECNHKGTKEAWYEKLIDDSAEIISDKNRQISSLTAENERLKNSEQDTITSLESDRIKQRDEQREIISSQQEQIRRWAFFMRRRGY